MRPAPRSFLRLPFTRPLVCAALLLALGCGRSPTAIQDSGLAAPPTQWVRIPAGTFQMGSHATEPCRSPEEQLHQVTFTRALLVWPTEVTQSQFSTLMGYNPSTFGPAGFQPGCPWTSCPVEEVNWHEAAAYCNALSSAGSHASCYTCHGSGAKVECAEAALYAGTKFPACPGYRLPTESEWEYAYRAGSTTALYSGSPTTCSPASPEADAMAWHRGNANKSTHPAAAKLPNAWGLYDMGGNVWEWSNDRDNFPAEVAVVDPVGPATGITMALRGGSWSEAWGSARAAGGTGFFPEARGNYVGFRCVRSAP